MLNPPIDDNYQLRQRRPKPDGSESVCIGMSASGSEQQHELGLGGDEDIVVAASTNAEDARFDEVVGAIEEIIMEEEFQAIQDDFMTKNYKHFEDSDENKLIYTTVHNEYVSLVEKYLDGALKRKVKGFDMDSFLRTLVERKEELEGEIFELLLTFDDFLEFKQLMLSFKSEKEGRNVDLGLGMCIQSISLESGKLMPPTPRGKVADGKGSKRTPLLDNAQMDQDDE